MMYSTCLHCTKSLGTNDVLETLPIGRRVAFDADKGRLWVVCRECARWNLVPFDTRLESIDACERLYRDTPTRYATDNIGLARTKEGLELVRIGQPLRPEFASWRYGDSFGRRRRRNLVLGAGAVVVGTAVWSGLMWVGGIVGIGGLGVNVAVTAYKAIMRERNGIPVLTDNGERRSISPVAIPSLRIERDVEYGWALRGVLHPSLSQSVDARKMTVWGEPFRLVGSEAERVLVRALPRVNGADGRPRDVRQAIELMSARGDLVRLLTRGPSLQRESEFARELGPQPPSWRLAIEMALHEHREREALEGELKLLEREWREAEQLAKIADDLLLAQETRDT